jgi:hypothetical protein
MPQIENDCQFRWFDFANLGGFAPWRETPLLSWIKFNQSRKDAQQPAK